MAEIGFESLAREMTQRDEGLFLRLASCADEASHLAVAPGVAMLVLETAKDLHGSVPLLGRRVLVVGQDLADDSV
jgi:hypothetical protein